MSSKARSTGRPAAAATTLEEDNLFNHLTTASTLSSPLMTRNDSDEAAAGILAIHAYFPNTYVMQSDLEAADGAPTGKYTVGLGQKAMAVVLDNEDVASMCMTVVSELLERHQIPFERIGRLEVGTESNHDKSKSIKSHLMQLFPPAVVDVGGVDNVNACYGATAALLNTIAWLESPEWDGRLALVVAADIAVYAAGPARPTGGAGAVAILMGPNAPLILERGSTAHYMGHSYDFYKPSPASEYPTVDGQSSIRCYLQALDACYNLHLQKKHQQLGLPPGEPAQSPSSSLGLGHFDYFVFHSPYGKLVQKSLGRLLFNDVLRGGGHGVEKQLILPDRHRDGLADSYFDRELDLLLLEKSRPLYEQMTLPTRRIPDEVGNTYCASLYMGLCSLLARLQELADAQTLGTRIGMFSYGSGLAATMFTLHLVGSMRGRCQGEAELETLLTSRHRIPAGDLAGILGERERLYGAVNWSPRAPTRQLRQGTFYLEHVDEGARRFYRRYHPIQHEQ